MSDILERLRNLDARVVSGKSYGVEQDVYAVAAEEIERLRGLLQNVLDAGEAEAKAEAEMRNAQRNYTNPRPYVAAWERAMMVASNAEREARAALGAEKCPQCGSVDPVNKDGHSVGCPLVPDTEGG